VLAEVLPRRLAHRLCELFLPDRPMRQLNAPQLQDIAARLHDWPIVASGTEGYRTAEVTLGGVDTDQLSSATDAVEAGAGTCISSARWSTSPAGLAVTTSVGLGLRPRRRRSR
jgi:predicted flavoprotein YhiN